MFYIQFLINTSLSLISLIGILLNRFNILLILINLEMLFLSINMTFIILSVYFEDMYGQLFSLFITTIAGAESAVGLAIIIVYYRVRGSIAVLQYPAIKN